MTKAVAYYRVSTAAQGRSGLGVEAQKAAVADLARQRGWQLLAEFTEVESGKRDDRPELAAALHHAKVTGARLVIAKLDRLGRNAAFLLTLRDSGVRFMAADLPDACDLTVGVLAVVAQAEREAISQGTKAALGTVKVKLAAGEVHVSRRSGLPVTRLGNPRGTEALRRAGRGNAAGTAAAKAKAEAHARDLAPVVERLRAEGCASLASLAVGLNAAGVRTPRDGSWHASSVRNLLARLG